MTSMAIVSFFITFLVVMTPAWCQHYEDTHRIFKDVLGSSRYNTDVRPVINQSDPIYVHVGFEILSIVEVNDITQSFVCNGIVQLRWFDERAVWNKNEYGGVETIHPSPKQIWRPRLVLVNTLDKRDLFEDDYSPTTMDGTGETWWFPGSLFPTSCKLDLTKYPFDEQHCRIEMLPMALRTHELIFVGGSVLKSSFTVNGAWEIVDAYVFTGIFTLPEGHLSHFEVRFHLRRRPRFFLLNILLPVVLLSFLNIMVFLIPVDSGEKISYGITVLLALTVFISIVSSMLPQSSDIIPNVVIYLFSLLVVSLLTVVDTIVIVLLNHMEVREEKNIKARHRFKSAISAVESMSRAESPTTTAAATDFNTLDRSKCTNNGNSDPSMAGIGQNSFGSRSRTGSGSGSGSQYPNIKDFRVKRNSWMDVMKALEKDDEGDDDKVDDRVNKYKMIGKHIDTISFIVFIIIWLTLTLWIFISMTT